MKRRRSSLTVSLISLLCAAAGCGGDPLTNPLDPQSPSYVAVAITSPREGELLNVADPDVVGTCPASLAEDIWVFVWPEQAPGMGWPQSAEGLGIKPTNRDGERWWVRVGLGGPPQRYGISAHTATREASAYLRAEMAEWSRTGVFPGLPANGLPTGLVERHRVSVIRVR